MLIRESDLPQGSPEWLEWRRAGIGGSEIFSLAARAKHWLKSLDPRLAERVALDQKPPSWVSTPRKVWMDKHGLLPGLDPRNPHLRRGHRVEPQVRDLAEYSWDCLLEPLCGFHENRPHSRVSLDGFSREKGILIEVKAPARHWDHLPEYPVWQSAYQGAVLRLLGERVLQTSILEGNEDEAFQVEVKNWVVFDNRTPRSRRRQAALGDALLDMVSLFWERYMATDIPPDCIPREKDTLA